VTDKSQLASHTAHSADDVRWVENVLAMFDEGTQAHRSWHMLVPQSISGGFGWCIDCLRLVPAPELNDGDVCGIDPPTQ
jgi:hypothetical protein